MYNKEVLHSFSLDFYFIHEPADQDDQNIYFSNMQRYPVCQTNVVFHAGEIQIICRESASVSKNIYG